MFRSIALILALALAVSAWECYKYNKEELHCIKINTAPNPEKKVCETKWEEMWEFMGRPRKTYGFNGPSGRKWTGGVNNPPGCDPACWCCAP